MPVFDTPQPISATIDRVFGDVRITASDRADTIVEVRPSDPSHEPDTQAAEQTRVEYAAGELLVKAPRQRGLGVFGKPGSIDVTIELPAGSQVRGDAAAADVRCTGPVGECRIKTGAGQIEVEEASLVDLSSGAGAITVDRVTGGAEVSTGSGKVRLHEIGGPAVIKSSNGDITVGQADGDITASTANGEVRVGAVTRGTASLKTAFGEVEVGIHNGTAARLDVHTKFGRIHNSLDAADSPAPAEETVEVRARTGFGDIVIRRA